MFCLHARSLTGPKEGSYVITFYVYFSRLIFELIADPDIQVELRTTTLPSLGR